MWPEFYLVCFAIGALWSAASLLLGGFHAGHSFHTGHPHIGHAHIGHGHAGHVHVSSGNGAHPTAAGWIGSMVNPSCAAVFLAWFGGVGYLLTRHSGLSFWFDLSIAAALGFSGAWFLASFLRFLQSREQPLDPADYDMVGVLGRVSSMLRTDGVGEVMYVRDGARRPVPARSDDGQEIKRGEEVIVTRYEKGIAYVRTWDAMTQKDEAALLSEPKTRKDEAIAGSLPKSSQKETKNVE